METSRHREKINRDTNLIARSFGALTLTLVMLGFGSALETKASAQEEFPQPVVLAEGNGVTFAMPSSANLGSAYDGTSENPVVGITAVPVKGQATDGYDLVAKDGQVAQIGGANYYGGAGYLKLDAPVVGIASTPDGGGYWEVAVDGGVFSFGDARFYGSMGGKKLDAPVVGIIPTPDGQGYWLAAKDGGVFSFGDAKFYGSAPEYYAESGLKSPNNFVGILPMNSSSGDGYVIYNSSGDSLYFSAASPARYVPSPVAHLSDVVGGVNVSVNAGL